jgi:hypothetical protein
MRGDGLDVRVIYRPTMAQRDWIADRQAATAHGVRMWSGAQVVREEIAEALRALGYVVPHLRAHRGSSAALLRSTDLVHARFGRSHEPAGRLDLHITHAMGLALTAANLRDDEPTMQATLSALLDSRRDAPIAATLAEADGAAHLPSSAPGRKHLRKRTADPVDYVARHLTLCRERAARDAWLMRGGRGKVPPSTVDDHLGRRVHRGDARLIAVDQVRVERAETARGGG